MTCIYGSYHVNIQGTQLSELFYLCGQNPLIDLQRRRWPWITPEIGDVAYTYFTYATYYYIVLRTSTHTREQIQKRRRKPFN